MIKTLNIGIAYKIKQKKGTEKEQTRNNLHKLVSH